MITQHYQLYTERTDASKNMARYYAMDITETLFGETCLTRRWGRIGSRGQMKTHLFRREEEAVRLFLELLRQKRSRGYRPASLEMQEKGPPARDSLGRRSMPVLVGFKRSSDRAEERGLDRKLQAEPSGA